MHALLRATSRQRNPLTATLQPDVIAGRCSLNQFHPHCIRLPLQSTFLRQILPGLQARMLKLCHSPAARRTHHGTEKVRIGQSSLSSFRTLRKFLLPSVPSCSRVADGQKRLSDYDYCGTGRIRQLSAHLWTS
ncbi:hypothetical protein CRENBAI_010961 [Crenichthys baileyi]|uniref:Uncharacterized protein n=1 Tax=Crenichthys baileyi TaxID=28760 RepID=A0AAV9R104_9TELE